MKSWTAIALTCISLVVLGPLSVLAIEPVVYNQYLQFRYDAQDMTDQPDYSSQTMNYQFTIGFPVASYRLGSVAVNGSLDYNGLTMNGESRSDLGLRNYGMSVNLFPYRRFHLGFNYQHSEAPRLYDEFHSKADRYGITYSLFLPNRPNIFFNWSRRDSSYNDFQDTWDRLEVSGSKSGKSYNYNFRFNRDDYSLKGSDLGWEGDYASFTYDRQLPKGWRFYGYSTGFHTENSWTMNFNSNVYGNWRRYMLNTTGGVSFGDGDGGSARSVSLSQSVALPLEKTTYYTVLSLSFNSSSSDAVGSSNDMANALMAGVVRDLGKNFKVYANASVNRQDYYDQNASSRTYSVGFSEGGLLPEIIQRSIFAITESSLQRRLRTEYPPGYLPPEISLEVLTSRQMEVGSQVFSFEYVHFDSDDDSKRDYFRADGTLRLNRHFDTTVRAEYLDETDIDGFKRNQGRFYWHNRFKLGRSSLSLNFNMTDGDYEVAGIKKDTKASSVSLAFYSRVWKVPYGIVCRYLDTNNEKYKSIYFFQNFSFRKLVLRTAIEQNYLPGDVKYSRFTFEIGRTFDSLMLFGGRFRR